MNSICSRYKLARRTAMAFSAVLFLSGCAAVGTPDGGKYDEIPPAVTGSSPKMGSTGVKSRKVTIDFSEYIKLENASENVVISPPQIEQPEIKVLGKKIQIELMDSLKDSSTYSIDFADAIKDNNEGNPLGNFCFKFSTGSVIDTLEVSGYVLSAADLEPVSGITVGLHSDLSDSAFLTKPFERVSRTDANGHFTVRGIAPGQYRIYAVRDMDGSFSYSSPNEMIAWSDSIIVPSMEPSYREDTIFNDEGLIDTTLLVPYTRFMPDDITLLAFTAKSTNQYIVKAERSEHEKAVIQFAIPLDSMPVLKGLNFDESDAYVLQHSEGFDTLTLWMTDTATYYRDTLDLMISYFGTDTAGVERMIDDTVSLVPKKSHESIVNARQKELLEKQEEKDKQLKKLQKNGDSLAIARLMEPEPVEFLKVGMTQGTGLSVYEQVAITFPEPVYFLSDTAIHVTEKVDSTYSGIPFELEQDSINILEYHIFAEWKPEHSYSIRLDSASVKGIWGKANDLTTQEISFASLEKFSTLTVNMTNAKPGYTVQIISSGKVIRQAKLDEKSSADFFLLTPGDYYVSMFDDANGNGKWDTGDYNTHTQPETVAFLNRKFTLKPDWYHETDTWDISSTPFFKQKPQSLAGKDNNKPQNTTDVHKKNVERLEKKAKQINAEKKQKEKKAKRRQERREYLRSKFQSA